MRSLSENSYLLLSHGSLVHGPVESADDRLLDFVQVVHTLRGVDEDVGSGPLGSEGPYLTRFGYVPLVRVREVAGAGLPGGGRRETRDKTKTKKGTQSLETLKF